MTSSVLLKLSPWCRVTVLRKQKSGFRKLFSTEREYLMGSLPNSAIIPSFLSSAKVTRGVFVCKIVLLQKTRQERARPLRGAVKFIFLQVVLGSAT